MFFLSFIPQTPPASQLLSAVHHHVTDDVTTDRRDLAIITRFCCRPKPSNLSPLFSRRTRLEMRRISTFENTVSCHSCHSTSVLFRCLVRHFSLITIIVTEHGHAEVSAIVAPPTNISTYFLPRDAL